MKNNTLIILVVAVLLLGGGGFYLMSSNSAKPAVDEKTTTQEKKMAPVNEGTMEEKKEGTTSTTMEEKKDMTKEITMAEIEKHATKDDCWFAIEGNVYDVTQYIASGKHAGGDAIIAGCGKDATAMFNKRADGEPHSDKARSFLPNFQIGVLAK